MWINFIYLYCCCQLVFYVYGQALEHRTQLIFTSSNETSSSGTALLSIRGQPAQWKLLNSVNLKQISQSKSMWWDKLAYSYKAGSLYLTESLQNRVAVLNLHNPNSTYHTVFFPSPLNNIKIVGIDFDWINEHLYIASSEGTVYMLGGSDLTQLKVVNLHLKVISIKCNPMLGFVYMVVDSAHGSSAMYRFTLNLSNARLILEDNLYDIRSLTINYYTNNLYWVNNHKLNRNQGIEQRCSIYSCSHDGTESVQIGTSISPCASNGIDTSMNYMVISNTLSSSLIIREIAVGGDKLISNLIKPPSSLLLYDRINQPDYLISNCMEKNGGCEQICFDQQLEQNNSGVVCDCEYGYTMSADDKSCVLDQSKISDYYCLVTDRINNDTSTLYLIDLTTHLSIKLPLGINGNLVGIHTCGDNRQCIITENDISRTTLTEQLNTQLLYNISDGSRIVGAELYDNILYIHKDEDSYTYIKSLSSNTEHILLEHTVYQPFDIRISPKNRKIYIRLGFLDRDENLKSGFSDRLVSYDLNGKNRRVIYTYTHSELLHFNIDQSGENVYYVTQRSDGREVYDYSIVDGSTRKLFNTDRLISGPVLLLDDYYYYIDTENTRGILRRNMYSGYESPLSATRMFNNLTSHFYIYALTNNKKQGNEFSTDQTSTGQPDKRDRNRDIIITVGVCFTLIVIIIIILLFYYFRLRNKRRIQRCNSKIHLASCASISSSCLNSQTPAARTVSILGSPLPALPIIHDHDGDAAYQSIENNYVDINNLCANERTSPHVIYSQVNKSRKSGTEVPLMRENSLYVTSEYDDYLKPNVSSPHRDYIEILPSTPVPKPRSIHRKESQYANSELSTRDLELSSREKDEPCEEMEAS